MRSALKAVLSNWRWGDGLADTELCLENDFAGWVRVIAHTIKDELSGRSAKLVRRLIHGRELRRSEFCQVEAVKTHQ